MNPLANYLLGSLLLLAACAGDAPPRIEDDLDITMPASWSSPVDESATVTILRNDWWRDFDDERLNDLIVAGLTDNQNLRAVMARLEAAVAAHEIAGGPLLPEIDELEPIEADEIPEGGRDGARHDADCLERVNLVVHQREERADADIDVFTLREQR